MIAGGAAEVIHCELHLYRTSPKAQIAHSLLKEAGIPPVAMRCLHYTEMQRFARLINTSSRAAAIALEPSHPAAKQALAASAMGNSFQSFADYRKSAVYHGPLKKKLANGQARRPEEQNEQIAQFARLARNTAYRE